MSLRDVVRDLSPPVIARSLRRVFGSGLRFEAGYASWADAQRASRGYGGEEIALRVLDAELKAKRGEAADARDGVNFDTVQYSLPVMAALARAAHIHGDGMRVLDVGGAFGNLYRHFRKFGLRNRVSWTVVEQPAYVKHGLAHFQDGQLRFDTSLDEALAGTPADLVLLSSVLQYLPDPHALIHRIAAWGPAEVVIDRTPCSALTRDILAVQHVPEEIYRASYPCWIFSRRRLLESFDPRYAPMASFVDSSGLWHAGSTAFAFTGFILEQRC